MESTITAKLATSSSNVIESNQLWSLQYWFNTPNELSLAKLAPFEIITTLIFIGALSLLTYKLLNTKLTPPDHKFLKRAVWLTIFLGPIGWILVLSRNWGIVFLSARFFWIIWFGVTIWVGYYLFRYYQRDLTESKKTFASYQLKQRYFPSKKKPRNKKK